MQAFFILNGLLIARFNSDLTLRFIIFKDNFSQHMRLKRFYFKFLEINGDLFYVT